VDRHVPLLTVEETLTFAFSCLEGGTHAGASTDGELTAEQKELVTFLDKRKNKVSARCVSARCSGGGATACLWGGGEGCVCEARTGVYVRL
jgi:hypothetical protein